MPPSFEELADAGISDSSKETRPVASPLRKRVVLTSLLLLAAATGCWYAYQQQNDKPLAAQILLDPPKGEPDVLPHTLDSATEFEDSLNFLKPEVPAPKVRETEAAQIAPEPIFVKPATTGLQIQSRLTEAEPETPPMEPTTPSETAEVVSIEAEVEYPVSNVEYSDAPPTNAVIDWGGIVLVPDQHVLAKAYNSDVRLLRIEAHPIDGDYIRVWARIQNRTDHTLNTEVGCEFRARDRFERPNFTSVTLQPHGVVDAYFVSQTPLIRSYTVLVKR